jgi:uncharacterized protein involved in exopolysaccharide biosynthesis
MMHALNAILARRGLLLLAGLVAATLAVVQVAMRPRVYRSETSFLTEGGRTSSVSSIAAQFGIGGGGTEGFASPMIYGDLASSGYFLRRVAMASAGQEFGNRSFADVVDAEGDTPAERLQDAAEEIDRMLDIEAAPRTGLVTIRAQAPAPELAKALADQVLAELSEIRSAVRVNRAAGERAFLEDRLKVAHADLRGAEDRLQGFLQRNRAFENDPARSIEHSRLMREATMKEEIYSGILYALEQVKADEQRTASGIMLVAQAELPVRPQPRSFVIPALAAFLLGAAAVATVLAVRASLSPERGGGSEAQLRLTLREIADDLRRGRIVRALLGTRRAA